MKKQVLYAAAAISAAVSAVTLLQVELSYAASGQEVIKTRIDFMKDDLEEHWRHLAAYAKAGKGSLADVEKNARALANSAKKIPAHFPKDTGRGNYADEVTRALPVIWTDWDGFEKEVQRLASESQKLARLAQEGNKDAVVTMIGTSGSYARTKIGCAECHQTFRGARVKK